MSVPRTIPQPVIEEILKEHRRAQKHHGDYIAAAIATGELLQRVKVKVGHGQFETWLAEHCKEIAGSTARRYMLAAKQNATGVAISALSRVSSNRRELVHPNGQIDEVRVKRGRICTPDEGRKQIAKLIANLRKGTPPMSDRQIADLFREALDGLDPPRSVNDDAIAVMHEPHGITH